MSASGNHVTKAVTVVELLKRRVPVSNNNNYYKVVHTVLCKSSLGIWD